jgi:uncharacterized protein
MEHNPVGWFEIYVDDMERSKTFYEFVLQTRLEKINNPEIEMWAFPMYVDRMGCPGAIVRMPGFSSGGNSTLVYFSCEDCATEEQRVIKAGGKLQRGKMSIGEYGFISLVFDTEGNMFGLHSKQ